MLSVLIPRIEMQGYRPHHQHVVCPDDAPSLIGDLVGELLLEVVDLHDFPSNRDHWFKVLTQSQRATGVHASTIRFLALILSTIGCIIQVQNPTGWTKREPPND